MSDHTRLNRKSTNTDGTGFMPARGASSLASTSADSFALQPSIAPSQTAPEIALSPQQETDSQTQENSDLSQSERQALPGHDFSKISLFWGAGQTAGQGEEPPNSSGNDRPVQRKPASSHWNALAGHDFSRVAVTLQAKLTVSQPDDPYEQEADRVAEQVMRMPESGNREPSQPQFSGHDFSQISIQPKLQPSTPLAASITPFVQREALLEDDDEPDIEADVKATDAIAEQPIEETEETEEEELIQTKRSLQRVAQDVEVTDEEEDELVQTKRSLQRVAQDNVKTEPDLEQQLTHNQGGGNSLPDETRNFMESRFGADFSSVRVHTDTSAVQMNQALNAQAFTHDNDIYFGAGKAPGKNDLTAHELTHTIQQTGGLQAKRLNRRSNQDNKLQTKVNLKPLLQRREDSSEAVPTDRASTESTPAPPSPTEARQSAEPPAVDAGARQSTNAPVTPTTEGTVNTEASASSSQPSAPTSSPPVPDQAVNLSDRASQAAGASPETKPGEIMAGNAPVTPEFQSQSSQPVFDSQPAISSNAQDPGQILEQLTNTPPTQAAAAYTQSQSASAQVLESQRQQVQATLPEIPAPTGLPAQTSVAGNAGQTTGNASVAQDRSTEKVSVGQLDQTAPPQPTMPSGQPEGNAPGQGQFNPLPNLPAQSSSPMPGAGNEVVSTSAGERPKVNLTGDADPSQMNPEQAQSSQQVQSAKTQAASGINQDFGENAIFPKASNETLKVNKELSRVAPPEGEVGMVPVLSPEAAGRLDQGLAPFYREKVGAEQNKYQVGKEKFDVDSTQARSDSNREVSHLNQETQQKQLEAQKQARQETVESRQAWRAELDNVEQDYQEKAGKATQEQRQKIDEEKTKGEQKADQHLKEAEQEAEEKKKKAEEDADKEKKKSERNTLGEKIVGFFEDVWEGIKKVVDSIFDALRKAVKAIFDAVKKVVESVIELARQVIVGLIKVFGEILKGLVQVVFAAFPEISKKFTEKIDQAVNKATEAVNSAADFLKKAVSSVLDFLSSTLDKLLGLVQDLFKGILTVIGMIITGQFGELIERFGNLIKGAEAMPPQFETAGLEELMGGDVDLDKPLAPEELAQAQQAGVNIPNQASEDASQTDEAGELPSAPWSEDNVGVDAVEEDMELSPEVTDELMQQTNGEGEVSLSESDDESRSMDAIMSEAAGEQQTKGEEEQQIPDDGLTPKQRASVKWELMKEGIKKWFSDNWPILLAALIAAAAVIIAAIVASGGAVLAALPILLGILTVVFAAEAIARIGGYLRDYLSKSWEGDIQGGGKSLAKALAAGAIELIMLLTAGVGKVAFKGAKAVAKGAQAAAKGAMKVFRGVIKGTKYIIQKGKVLFKGVAGTRIGQQFKRLKDLGQGLLDRMRFKAFRIRVANGWFRLEGLINPWVLIAEGKIRKAQQNTEGAVEVTDDELSALLAKTGEKTLPKLKSYEQARNKAFEFLGDFSPREPYRGTMNSSYGNGKVVGYQSADKKVRLRLDYDPNKGPHFNLEDFRAGKGDKAIKIAIPFEGNEQTFKTYIDLINDKWNGSLF